MCVITSEAHRLGPADFDPTVWKRCLHGYLWRLNQDGVSSFFQLMLLLMFSFYLNVKLHDKILFGDFLY
jgi:hypothetical protein